MIFVPFKGKIRVEINFFIRHSIPQSKNTHEDPFMKAFFFSTDLKNGHKIVSLKRGKGGMEIIETKISKLSVR